MDVAAGQARRSRRPALDIVNLQVKRGQRLVIPGLDVYVERGGITGLLGPSGGGKTTLMRAIVGTQKISAGTVTVLGHPAGARVLRRQVGYVTQAASVYDDLSVVENLKYFAGVIGQVPASRITEVLELTDMAAFSHTRVGRLSGGQRSRVSLAVALLGEPELLVLDEPTVGLDPVLRRSLWTLFAQLAADGTTLLVSSHVMDEAQRCDDLLLMHEGRIIAHDTVPGLLALTGTRSVEEAFIAIEERGEQ